MVTLADGYVIVPLRSRGLARAIGRPLSNALRAASARRRPGAPRPRCVPPPPLPGPPPLPQEGGRGPPRAEACGAGTANLRTSTKILDFRGFDSSIILILRDWA